MQTWGVIKPSARWSFGMQPEPYTPFLQFAVSFVVSAVSSVSAASFTFSSMSLGNNVGKDTYTRMSVVGAGGNNNVSGTITISSISIRAVSMTNINTFIANNLVVNSLRRLNTSSFSSTGDVIVTITGGGNLVGCGAVMYRVANAVSQTQSSAATASVATASASITLTTPSHGGAICYAVAASATDLTFTWTNAVEDQDQTIRSAAATHSAAHDTSSGSATITSCLSGTPSGHALNGAVWS